jgi:diguanylate cyclase (GGDEF)-like protein
MRDVFMKALLWIFLGPAAKDFFKRDGIFKVVTLNILMTVGTVYILTFFTYLLLNGQCPLHYMVVAYVSAFLYIASCIAVHTEIGIKYFEYIKTMIILDVMIFFGMLYTSPLIGLHGDIWTFLIPTMVIFVMELKWGIIFCSAYFAYMLAAEFFFEPHSTAQFARYASVFLAQMLIIISYELLRGATRNRLLKDKQKIEYLSITDHLTKLYNRRYFSESIEMEFAKAMSQNENICFLMIDADHFKEYNDAYGHIQGDEMLIAIAGVLRRLLRRSNDLAFRMGGEEFGILLPNADHKWALLFAEKVRQEISEMKVPLLNGNGETGLTISIGLACIKPRAGDSPEMLMKQADNNLYEAKLAGRNRVIGYRRVNE